MTLPGRWEDYPVATLRELPERLRKAALAVWTTDRSLAKTYDQIRRAEVARSRLEAIRAALAAARQRSK
jgi:phytoene/squalene synthetase